VLLELKEMQVPLVSLVLEDPLGYPEVLESLVLKEKLVYKVNEVSRESLV